MCGKNWIFSIQASLHYEFIQIPFICLFEYSGDREVFGNITYWYIHKNKCWVYAYWHWLNLQWCLSQLHPFIIITLILWHLETSWSTSTTRTWPKSKATRSTIMSVCIFSTLIFFSVRDIEVREGTSMWWLNLWTAALQREFTWCTE